MTVDVKKLLDAGVHFGHLTRKRHPNMSPYIFMEKNGTHILDLNQTIHKLDEGLTALSKIAKTGRRILFVATKKQAKWRPKNTPDKIALFKFFLLLKFPCFLKTENNQRIKAAKLILQKASIIPSTLFCWFNIFAATGEVLTASIANIRIIDIFILLRPIIRF